MTPAADAPPTRRWVAFLRAINGAPANRIKMVDLARLLREAGCDDVSWHIQTGNMFFAAPDDRLAVAAAIEARLAEHGMKRADAMLVTAAELRQIVNDCAQLAALDPEQWQPTVSFFRTPPAHPDPEWFIEQGCILGHLGPLAVGMAFPRNDEGGAGYGLFDKRWKVTSTGRWLGVVRAVAEQAGELDPDLR